MCGWVVCPARITVSAAGRAERLAVQPWLTFVRSQSCQTTTIPWHTRVQTYVQTHSPLVTHIQTYKCTSTHTRARCGCPTGSSAERSSRLSSDGRGNFGGPPKPPSLGSKLRARARAHPDTAARRRRRSRALSAPAGKPADVAGEEDRSRSCCITTSACGDQGDGVGQAQAIFL